MDSDIWWNATKSVLACASRFGCELCNRSLNESGDRGVRCHTQDHSTPGGVDPHRGGGCLESWCRFRESFPCGPVGGDRYIKALHTSLPQVPLIAAGGVNQQTAGSFILSGATAIGVGTELIPTEAIQRRQSQRIHELARRFLKLVKDARQQIEAWEKSQVVKKYTEAQKCET